MPSYTEPFRTYANYVRAFAELAGLSKFALGTGAGTLAPLDARITANLAAAPANVVPNLDQARASLQHAWGTELLVNVTARYAQEAELIGLSNTWASVQVYYAAYHATQALLAAYGYPRPDSHPKTQRMFLDLWVMKPLNLPPWSMGFDFNGVRNGPPGRDVVDVHPWTGCDGTTCWDLAGKALRTTRDDAVADGWQRLREQKHRERRKQFATAGKVGDVPRANLTQIEKLKIAVGVRPYSLLDFLFRLRIKSNYEEAAVFVEGPESPAHSRLLRRDLIHLASASLLLVERHLAQVVGVGTLTTWMDVWLDRNHPPGREMGLKVRRPLF